MYCENCGTKLRDGAKFCRNCGKQIGQSMPYSKNVFSNVTQPLEGENGEMTSPIKADIPESGEGLTGWFKNRRNVVICIVLAVLIIMLVVCGILFVKHLQKPQEEPDTEQIEAATEATEEILEDISEEIKEEMMLVVKGEKSVNYPEITYEEAFANYFTSPEWTCFRGTKEGPDDDGDGNPDYELEGIEIVQFTGDCVYSDAQVKALIQFCKDNDTGIYQITYVSFDGKPQSTSVMSEFVDVIFRTYVEATTVIEETEVVESVEAEEPNSSAESADSEVVEDTNNSQDYNSVITEEMLRRCNDIPSDAEICIKYGEPYYNQSYGCYIVNVDMSGLGVYSGYYACGEYSVETGEVFGGIMAWDNYEW